MAQSNGVHKPSPVTRRSPAASELTRDCVFSISAVSRRCVSSVCLALDRTWKVALAAELGAKNLVAEERPLCARGRNRAAATRFPRACTRQRPGPEHRGSGACSRAPTLGFFQIEIRTQGAWFPGQCPSVLHSAALVNRNT